MWITIGPSIVFYASSDDPNASWKNSTIAVRSNCDRGAIEPRSWSVRCGINSTIVRQVFVRICSEIDAQSTHDQATIVVDCGRSRRKSWLGISGKRGKIKANSWPIPKLRLRPKESFPLPIKPPPRSPSLPRSSGQFPSLKACISLLCSSTFDQFVKELSEFQGRSLVHRDPPAFRLDCDAIRAGLIANFSLISSNFALEFRTSPRKNLSKFTSIHEIEAPFLRQSG